MDLLFETQKRAPFTIEIGYFDTVLEIKEKVQKYQGIPVSKQTLIFNGHVLQDEHDVERCILLHNSHVQLLVAPDSDIQRTVTTDQELSPSMKKIQLTLKIPSSSKMQVTVEMEPSDSVLKLKEKLQEMEGVPANNLLLKDPTGVELQDHKSLNEYHELIECPEIHVGFKALHTTGSSSAMTTSTTGTGTAAAAVSAGAGGSKKMKLFVLQMGGTKKIAVEMNGNDNVGELRKELQKLQFPIPQEGYFFIYKQNVMDDDRSFRWHHVSNGETIEIFNGSISGGS